MIADFLLQKKETAWAMKMIAHMPSSMYEEQYMLLQRIGKYKEVLDLAADRKDLDVLENIQSTLLDSNLLAYANEKIAQLKRK